MLAILPSSLLSRVFPGSERRQFTSMGGPRGPGRASAEILDFQMPIFFGDPLKSLQICSPDIPKSAEKVPKTDLSVGEIWAPKIAPTLRGKKNPITRWGPPVLRLIHPKLVYHCVLFTHFSFFSPKSALLTRKYKKIKENKNKINKK